MPRRLPQPLRPPAAFMRLNSIKLSGFKSFAEPTHFQLPGQLVGVVGPNGCGKSNIMDAVRWVLGESKASELRGESMQDVIFSGSGLRKPAGRASVELVFGNEDARAGGQWNQFAEIAVKRVLTRDGTSSYYINNQPVRRRDVQDVFLGTGLGPRAYAIIGQGTISRIIESRPEELRLFLEEAAGVSKYKERRRETESRLKDTRENMTRVQDILRELGANLERLEGQAEVAQRYRGLQDAAQLKQHQLWFLKHRDAASEQQRVQREAQAAGTALEARIAELRAIEAALEAQRQQHYAAGDALHAAQGELAEAALEVSRLEERIRYVVEGRQRIEQRLAELAAQGERWQSLQADAQAEQATLGVRFEEAVAQGERLDEQLATEAAKLPAFEQDWRAAQARSQAQRAEVVQTQQQIQVLAAEARHVDERWRQVAARQERLAAEDRALAAPDDTRIAELQRQAAEAAQQREAAAQALESLRAGQPLLDDERRLRQEAASQEAARQGAIAARLEALRALQEKVQTEGKLKPWLARHGLDGLQGLWTRIHIETGWETALEAALRERLAALAVGRIETVAAFAQDAPPARLAFYTTPAQAMASTHRTLPRLADLLRLGDAGLQALLADWLEGVYTAPSLADALAARAQLTHGEVIMTAAGHAVSQFAVSFYAPDSEQAGLLARAQEIENLALQLRAQVLIADEARSALVRAEAACSDAAQRLQSAQREAVDRQTLAHQLEVELLRLSEQAQAARARRTRLGEEQAELGAQAEALAAQRAAGESRFETLDAQLATQQERHAALDEAVAQAEAALAAARQQLRTLERDAQESQFARRALEARRAELERNLETAQQQLQAQTEAVRQARAELDALTDAADRAGLQTALELRVAREQALGGRRSAYDELSQQLRHSDEQRLACERSLQPLREAIVRLQLEEQAAALGGAQYLEQLSAAGADLAAVEEGVRSGGVRLAGLQAEIDRLQREIAALGAVNLAALEELGTARERKTLLDAQMADLQEAIATLEGAIHKIDLETRELLASTFEAVNGHFGRMFPILFGGGNARLVMTGDEILDAGVQVMAQPPGKKNSSIHLLSGGEKALTAIALVFAIFQLNPAPFCLLDEVDAPLDDANTDRYAALVKEMAQSTQFLFISHNKIAMEMAEQLVGVTMQEQGVSRIVAVDMTTAVGLAEAA